MLLTGLVTYTRIGTDRIVTDTYKVTVRVVTETNTDTNRISIWYI